MARRKVLVTGGSRGIGRATVARLAGSGMWDVTFTYRSRKEEAEAVVAEWASKDARVRCVALDLLDRPGVEATVKAVVAEEGGFDAVVHNAGMTADTNFFFMDDWQWDDVINTSLNSFYVLNKACLPHMIANRWGRIVTLASVAGEMGNRGQVNYSAAKGALLSATKALAREVAGKGVLCNSVSPGIIATDMTKDMPDYSRMIPQGRYGEPGEVAACVAFLLSDDASYVNGSVIRVNGGFLT